MKSWELSYLNRILSVLLVFLPFLKKIESLQLAPIGVLYFQCLRQYSRVPNISVGRNKRVGGKMFEKSINV